MAQIRLGRVKRNNYLLMHDRDLPDPAECHDIETRVWILHTPQEGEDMLPRRRAFVVGMVGSMYVFMRDLSILIAATHRLK